ncbi:MAG: lipopolysaccharide kinase InaA family protein [Planctomycetota bacterium]|jgi:tRNA A-37 threonylcarbamoyl transferase component Bud32
MTQRHPPQQRLTQDDLVDHRTERIRCLVDVQYQNTLLPLLEKADPGEWPGWTKIKETTVRTIFRGAVTDPHGNDIAMHIKLFRAVNLSDHARDALGGARSLKEFKNLREARRRGLPCIRPVAAGSFRGSCGSRSFLLTVTEEGEALSRGPLPAAAAAAAGRLLRDAHDRGLHARDLHSGNLLQRSDGALLLLDLTSAELASPLQDRQRARALAYFCMDLDGLVRDPAARPLLEAYGASPALLERTEREARRLRNRALSAFGRRAFRHGSWTHVEKRPKQPRCYLHGPQKDLWDEARDLIQNLDSLTPVKSGRRGAVFVRGGLVAKRRHAGAARQLFQNAYWLDFAGVPVAAPVALQAQAGLGVVVSCRLPWPTLMAEVAAGLSGDALASAATELGHAVGRMHSFGLRNRDMKLKNLIREPDSNRVFMVDLDGIRRKVPLDDRGRAADLGRLLAAFREAGSPGGAGTLRRFARGYASTCRRLCNSVRLRHLACHTEARASEWPCAPRTTRA